jgi:hypothetical protein
MQFRYLVHSCAVEPVVVSATLPSGAKVDANVNGLVVEFVSEDGLSTITPRYIPADLAADLAAFPVGRAVTLTIEPEQA